MTPFEQLRQKPREVQVVLFALILSHGGMEYAGTKLASLGPGLADYDRYLVRVLAAWDDARAQHPNRSEINLARDLDAQLSLDPNYRYWPRLIQTAEECLPR